jgi:replicative DNA helicase
MMIRHFSDYLPDSPDLFEAGAADGDPAVVATGFEELDALTAGGLRSETLTVIASRPGMGRTTFMADILRRCAIHGGRAVAVWTMEESGYEFTSRLLSAEARVARSSLQSGLLDEEGRTRAAEALSRIREAPLYLATPEFITIAELAEEARVLVQAHGVKVIAVDGIQGIRPQKRNDPREREDVVQGLKTIARRLKVPVIATSHLNRSPEQRIDKVPHPDDLSDSITYGADLLILPHREDNYDRESSRAGEADLILAKYRHGPLGTLTVAFQGHYGRFVDLAPYREQERNDLARHVPQESAPPTAGGEER